MMTPRHSRNRGMGNPLAHRASLLKPLIPLIQIPEIARKYSQHGGLPCVIFLKVARWWNPSQ